MIKTSKFCFTNFFKVYKISYKTIALIEIIGNAR